METNREESSIITGGDLNHRTFRDDESWNSLQSTILAGHLSTEGETDTSTSVDVAEKKENLTIVHEEEDDEFNEDVIEDSNLLNMNIDAISDDEVFFDCPSILSPKPYAKVLRSPSKVKFTAAKLYVPQSKHFLTIDSSSSYTYSDSAADSGLDGERTASMIGQIIEDFKDMKDHAQSTPKITSDYSEYVSSISSTNDLSSKRSENDATSGEVVEKIDEKQFELAGEKKKIELAVDDNGSKKKLIFVDETNSDKRKLKLPSEMYTFMKKLDYADNNVPTNLDSYTDSYKEKLYFTEDKNDQEKSELSIETTSGKKKLYFTQDKNDQEKSELSIEIASGKEKLDFTNEKDGDKKKTDVPVEKESGDKMLDLTHKNDGNKKKLDSTDEKKKSNKMQLDIPFEKDGKITNEKIDGKKKLETSDSNNVTTKKNDGNRSLSTAKTMNMYYMCPSPADKTNKENYYAGKYSRYVPKTNIPKLKSPTIVKRPRRVAQMKEFFENRNRIDNNNNSNSNDVTQNRIKKPPISKKIELCKLALSRSKKSSPKCTSYHTQETFKLRRSSRTYTLNSENLGTFNSSGSSSFILRNAPASNASSRYLRPASCSEYPSSYTTDTFSNSQLSTERSKSMDNLAITNELSASVQGSDLQIAIQTNKIAMRAHVLANNRSTLHKKSPKKQPLPKSPKKTSDIMKRRSLGFVSSPVKPVKELRKMFSPSMGVNGNPTKKHVNRPSKTLPHIIVNKI